MSASLSVPITPTIASDVAPESPSTQAQARKRLRVLMCAFAASPVRGSEPSFGWNIPLHLAKHHDMTVLAAPEAANEPLRDEIEAWFRANGPVRGLTFHFVERPPMSKLLQRDDQNASLLRPFYYTGYAAWQRAALKEARRLHAIQPFDVVHHLNITGYREPSYLWKLDAPFVWGPIGGAANIPWSYFDGFGLKDRLFYALRNLTNEAQKRLKFRSRKAAARAAHIWFIGEDERRMVSEIWGRPCSQLTETAPKEIFDLPPRVYDGKRPLKLAWSGAHIGRKALPIALEAIARLPDIPLELAVLGTGGSMPRWQALAWQLRIMEKVKWLGWLPHAQAIAALADADAFVFTGLQEGTPAVVPEALSMGLPVICHDACGMKFAVTDDCGIKIPRVSTQQSIEGFAAAIRRFVDNTGEIERFSRGAQQRARELSWEAKARTIAGVYENVVAARSGSGRSVQSAQV